MSWQRISHGGECLTPTPSMPKFHPERWLQCVKLMTVSIVENNESKPSLTMPVGKILHCPGFLAQNDIREQYNSLLQHSR